MCILIDSKHKALIDSKSGITVYPPCFDDLVSLHAYFLGSRYPEEATKLLKRVFKGEKPVTEIVEKARGQK